MRHIVLASVIGLSTGAMATAPQHPEGRSSVVAEYLSLELGALSPCARELHPTKIAFPVEGGRGVIEQTYTDTCRGAPASMKLTLELKRRGADYELLITEPNGEPLPVSLTLGKHRSVLLDQGELDLSLTRYGG